MAARPINKLSAKAVANLKEPGLHADGGGLYLRIAKTGGRSWTFIYFTNGKRRETGFGSANDVSLAVARDKRAAARAKVDAGIDPALPELPANAGDETFGETAEALLAALEAGWKNEKHRWQWRQTLETYCAPIWNKRVRDVDTNDVLAILTPIWASVPETATRLRGRIERVLDAAKVKGFREGDNPARWRGHLSVILPNRKKLGPKKHHAAMPWRDVPAFIPRIRAKPSTAARALQFLILTVPRTTEVLLMKWKEVDLDAAVWVIPAERMKMGIEHRVALSTYAVALLRSMAVFGTSPNAYVFPGKAAGKPLSNMAMEMVMRRSLADDYTVHGFRSSFRDWAAEVTDYPSEIAEAALAHQVGSEVERAYKRTDFFDRRRELMEDWGAYVCVPPAD
jgi:integrase